MSRRDFYANPDWAKTSAERAQRLVGRNIRHLRENRGWTRPQASAEAARQGLDYSVTVWERIEAASRGLTIAEAAGFAEFFGVGVGDLFAVSPPCKKCGRMGTPTLPRLLPAPPGEPAPEAIHEFEVTLNRAPSVREAARIHRAVGNEDGYVSAGETSFWTIHVGGPTFEDAVRTVIERIRTVEGFDAALDPRQSRRTATARRWLYGWEVQIEGAGTVHIDQFDAHAFMSVRDRGLLTDDGEWIDGPAFMSLLPGAYATACTAEGGVQHA